MLPIYQAQGFDRILDGGSTRPWLVIVMVDDLPTPFVVKLYKKKHIDESGAVSKEVYSSILAGEFGLKTPSPALIEFPTSFINSLGNELKEQINDSDNRIKFGCQFIDGSYPYIDTLHKDSLKKYDTETIYAFDNLIKNTDRRKDKSNILLKGSDSYLIDHELTLNVSHQTVSAFKENRWVYFKQRHIFYDLLRNSSAKDKANFFNDFKGYLNDIDFDILDSYGKQMVSFGHDTEDIYLEIKEYLCILKENSDRFINLLKGGLG